MGNKEENDTPKLAPAWKLALAWLAVGVPLVWGVVETLKKAMALFGAA